jgi:hypothetical protein
MATKTTDELLYNTDELSLTSEMNQANSTGFEAFAVYPLKLAGKPLHLKLAQDLESVSVAFEPSGHGTMGSRKNITLNVPQHVFEAFAALEEACRQTLATFEPDVNALWHSCVRPQQVFPASVRAKINTSGPRAARFYDSANVPTGPPEAWTGLPVNAVLHARGCYVHRLPNGRPAAYGLMLEVTHLNYGASPAEVCPF